MPVRAPFASALFLGCIIAFSFLGCDDKAPSETLPVPDNPLASDQADPKPPSTPASSPTSSPEPAPAASAALGADEKSELEAPPTAAAPVTTPKGTTALPVAELKVADTKPAASAPEPEPKKGENVSGASFSTWLQSSGTYEVGKQGQVTAVLVAKGPYKCNDKYPYRFVLDAPSAGVSYPQTTVRGMQIGAKRSSMAIPFVPSQAGPATVSGTLHFSVCTDERCLIEKRKMAVTVDVK